ncbi:MAG: class I SAM-dependent methyltransferase [Solobacterium sp.]|nr:class I SAM-dependent methyltransferase [Solobacterium sp.]
MDHQLAPSVFARSAFGRQTMGSAVNNSCRQIVLNTGGCDTTALRIHNKDAKLFDLDLPEVISDKEQR